MASESTQTPPASAPPQRGINIPEMTVSGLSITLQRTLEDAFGRVRVRGEIAGMKLASSGHLYADLKDENANINIICWRSTLSRLKIRPEDGMDVICTGKITTYPKSSRYQLIVDSIELAGEGALLKLLEDRRRKLAAEGLFDDARKKPLPRIPRRIGIVTSPTGAVIQDILHRLRDRFPRPVLIWPVAVQGDGAAGQIAAAIEGFNALTGAQRPDLLIVARGGGSLEDLMAFNEENVVRAAAASQIPLISAVGHETDTTLIDYAADRRAPTPTAAAEMAVPVRAELLELLHHHNHRLSALMTQKLSLMHERIRTARAHLGDPMRLVQVKIQQLDFIAHRLGTNAATLVQARRARLNETSASLRHPRQILQEKNRVLGTLAQRLGDLAPRLLNPHTQRLDRGASLLEAFSFHNVLKRGFAVVRAPDGTPLTAAGQARPGDITVEFHDGTREGTLK